MLLILVLAPLLCCGAVEQARVQTLSYEPGSTLLLEMVACPEAYVCLMNVIGESGLLGENVAVYVGRHYQVPSANYPGCRIEEFKGIVAATFLEETLRNADLIVLVNSRKPQNSSWLVGDLYVDDEEVTVLMFRMQLAVPRGIKVDWCEKRSRRLEV
jgi:hypothetical protein